MMGRSHAMSGMAAGVFLFSPLAVPVGGSVVPLALHLGGMSGSYVAVVCVTMAVAALLPDWDCPSSLVSTSLPPVSGWVSRVLARGGHRRFTHVLVGFVSFTLVVVVLSGPVLRLGGVLVRPGSGLVLMVVAATGARAVGARSGAVLWGAGVVGLLAGVSLPAPALWFMPTAVLAGMWVHRLGDGLTVQGVENLLWPLVRRPRLRLPVLGESGSRREAVLFWVMGAYTLMGVVTATGVG